MNIKLTHILTFNFFLSLLVTNLGQAPINDFCENATVLCFKENNEGTNYFATKTNCNNCSDWDSIHNCFEINNSVWYRFMTNNQGGSAQLNIAEIFCSGDTNNLFGNELEAVVIKADTPCDYSSYEYVSNCTSGSNEFTIDLYGLIENQTYFVLIDGGTENSGTMASFASCNYVITIDGEAVNPNINAGDDIYADINSPISLNGQGQGAPSWFPITGLSNPNSYDPTVDIDISTAFQLTLTQSNNCSYTDVVNVYIQKPLSVYNLITPNNDGYNDVWIVENIESYPSCKVSVFSSWGQRIYYSIGYPDNNRWDGTNNGKDIPAGVYYYTIETGSKNNSFNYSGSIYLLK